VAVPRDPAPARQAAGPRPTVEGTRRRRAYQAAAAALLLALAAQLAYALVSDGLTHDEVLYVAAGRRHLAFGDFRVNPDQPPLAKILAATGLAGLGVRDSVPAAGEPVLDWAYRFVHVDNDASALIPRARIPVAAITLALAGLVAWWARREYGDPAALFALGLAAFHPSLLAHGHLATTDLAAAASMVAASFAFCRWLERPTLARAALVGLALGLAVGTRLTGWLLVPALVVAGVPGWRTRRPSIPGALALAALVTLLVVWAAYGFRFAPWPTATLVPEGGRLGLMGETLRVLHAAHVLPEAYLEGARFQLVHGRGGHLAYLLGGFSHTGWRHYYLVALLVKSTPAFLLACVMAAAVRWRRGALTTSETVWLCVAATVLLAASLGRIDLGERYVLALHPFLILLAASAVPHLLRWRYGALLLVVVVGMHAVSALRQAPRGMLAYFNVIAGGTDRGHRVLLDSNLDWGQDLPRLAAWMRAHDVPRVQLAYQGSDDPARFGIARDDAPGLHLHPPVPGPRTARLLAVSPDLLYGLSRADDPYAPLRERAPDGRAGVFFLFRDPPLIEAPDRRP
jgi:4-amino-4-deoxy-L-arabinose transferase-like glycosyltransferase